MEPELELLVETKGMRSVAAVSSRDKGTASWHQHAAAAGRAAESLPLAKTRETRVCGENKLTLSDGVHTLLLNDCNYSLKQAEPMEDPPESRAGLTILTLESFHSNTLVTAY